MTAAPARRALAARLSLEGRHALVTGAASGIGLAMCRGLLEFGAHVTMVDVDEPALHRRGDELAASGSAGSVARAHCDVSRPDDVADVIAAAAAGRGRLDAVFANAGVAGEPAIESDEGRLYHADIASFERTLAVNLTGALSTIRAAATAMRASGGSIVVTVSTAGLRGESMVGYGYSASKAALANVVRQAAIDLAGDGIRVNGIAPGPIRTNIGGAGPIPPEIEQKWSDTVLLGRMGSADEIEGLAVLLASDAASFITGAVIPVDGGASCGYYHTLPRRGPGEPPAT